jgi:uncharacterized membrane protein YccC
MTVPPTPGHSSRPHIWQHAIQSALRIDRTLLEPLAALRCTVGVGVPLTMALLAGQPVSGMFIAIGAVSAGFGSFQGVYRSRAATMLLSTAGMAFSLLVGSLAGYSTIAAATVAAVWGFAAGMFVALGPAAAFVALQSTVAVLVAAAYATSLGDALGRAALVVAGGLGQTLLVVSVWPLRRFRTERRVIGQVYASLAEYAGRLPQRILMPPEPNTLTQVGSVRRDPQPFARADELLVFLGLLDEAERIRASLAALSLVPAGEQQTVAEPLSNVLREIAHAIEQGRAPVPPQHEWHALDAAAVTLRATATPVDSLIGQLRAACRMAGVPAIDGGAGERTVTRVRTALPVRNSLETLRANLSIHSTACRHAIRLGTTLGGATAAYRLASLPRGYWIPMTALFVLKPELRATYVAGLTRILGTLAGAGLAVWLVATFGSDPAEVTVLLLVFVWCMYALFRANYVASAICITGYIVLLLYLAGVPGPTTAKYRALDTLVGGVLALAVYRVWPTWESRRVPDLLATQIEAVGRDSDVLLGAYVDPGSWDPKRLQKTQAAARLARSNAEASVERMLGEPADRDRFDRQLALSLLAALRRYALGALALHAGVDTRPASPVPELAPLRDQLIASLGMLANALRAGTPPGVLPPLRHTQLQLQATAAGALAEQTDILVDSINTAAGLLNSRPRHERTDL